jgi:hypothetical protein
MFGDHRLWIDPWVVSSVETPVGLNHLDSELCWCDPVIELDEDGREAVVHRQVTWN